MWYVIYILRISIFDQLFQNNIFVEKKFIKWYFGFGVHMNFLAEAKNLNNQTNLNHTNGDQGSFILSSFRSLNALKVLSDGISLLSQNSTQLLIEK